jgi:transcriptional regulator with GAF, ATPase, and Fis domain
MSQVWSYVFGQVSRFPYDEARDRFRPAGLITCPLNPNKLGGSGIIFFDEITNSLCDFLKSTSHGGLDRVLAIAVAGHALTTDGVWQLLQAGASDVFAWDRVADPAKEAAIRFERWEAVDQLVQSPLVLDVLVGHGPVWTTILRRIVELASFTNAAVLITGDSGTGKELAARLIHTLDRRQSKGNLVILDCTTIVPELAGSEFFGHERGAFTGAVAARDGAFASANGGTLFLDEVGELPPTLQAQLLRAIQERTYKRVGGNAWQHTDFRLVCATNKDLMEQVTQGHFRHDLYYRIASVICHMPPLRERTEDILPLAHHFITDLRPDLESVTLDEPVQDYLVKRSYPGNVRDLKQLIIRIMYRHVGSGPITVGAIPQEEWLAAGHEQTEWRDEAFEGAIRRALVQGVRLKEIGRAAQEIAVQIAVSKENGNLQRAASNLGVTDRALQMRRAGRRMQDQGQKTERKR